MLKLDGAHAHYGKSHVLQGVSLEVRDGEAVGLLGRNGVGKTTTLKTIMGLVRATGGSISFGAARLEKTPPHRIPRLGIGYVPQGRRIFPNLSVLENLCLGLEKDPLDGELDGIFSRFPVLKERAHLPGGTLSGGEQQMLAIARCLVMKPRLILLDEPTEGIMPKLVASLREDIKAINREGVSILLVEQNIRTALAVCGRIYIMEKGVICHQGPSAELRQSPEIVHRFLGVAL